MVLGVSSPVEICAEPLEPIVEGSGALDESLNLALSLDVAGNAPVLQDREYAAIV
jgi:hypothetical protein